MYTNINMDFDERVALDTRQLPWVASRLAGVQRRMLEREGAETGRATTIVRYAPHSHFSSHVHTGGEEFLVLDGVFSDEFGDFGPGSYVRNPIGSRHRPHSDDGCTIFVKLSQMEADDQEFVRKDTTALPWRPGPAKGVSVMPLHRFQGEEVALYKWEPGSEPFDTGVQGGTELLVLTGEIAAAHERYTQGTWIRGPEIGRLFPDNSVGGTAYVKTGHLRRHRDHKSMIVSNLNSSLPRPPAIPARLPENL